MFLGGFFPDLMSPVLLSASCPLVAVGEQTLGFLEKLHSAAGGPMDIRRLNRNRRLQDIINIMEGICLIERKSAYHVKWM